MNIDWDAWKRSPRVKLFKDYERCWYMYLILEAYYNTDKPGWVLNDRRLLYRLSGCTADWQFWDRNCDAVLAAGRVSDDGRWLTFPRVLREVEKKTEKSNTNANNRRSTVVSVSSNEDRVLLDLLDFDLLERIYKQYPRKVAPKKAYPAIQKAITRLTRAPLYQHARDLHEIANQSQAIEFIEKQVCTFAKSAAGNLGKFTPHPASWFNADRFLDDPEEWNDDGKDQQNLSAKERRIVTTQDAFRSAIGNPNRENPLRVRHAASDAAHTGRNRLLVGPTE